jgi:glucosamine-6-phosphate deaminase
VRIHVFSDEQSLAEDLAGRIAGFVREHPSAVLGLPTGRTPVLLYKVLAGHAASGALDLSQVSTFNLDEFLGLPADHRGSYRRFMQEHLFAHVNLRPERIGFLDGMAPDVEAECRRYEQAITAAGGIDLQILGIGANGHIGFNEPAPGLAARTHRVTLTRGTRESNAGLFGDDVTRVPHEALSMGMATILGARRLVLVATGAGKAECVRGMIEGPLTTALPASFLQVHGDVDVMLDVAAAAGLRERR